MTTVAKQPKKTPSTRKLIVAGKSSAPTMKQVGAVILGGGQGTRLHPLTLTTSKPSISFGGYYRIIDVAISNAINSGCQKISIITQFFSTTLHQHIYRTYRDDSFANGYMQLLTAEERPAQKGWFSGTADAVRQNLGYLAETSADYFLILSGDQLYNFDFQEMLDFAYASDADLTIASTPVDQEKAKRMGILKINKNQEITGFLEKPAQPDTHADFTIPDQIQKNLETDANPFLASMGIYLFKRQALIDLLLQDDREDFGKHLIPKMVNQGKASAFLYSGYWEDIGTIDSYHKANIDLTQQNSSFSYYNDAWPLFCRHHNLPAPKIGQTSLNNVIICEGSIIEADEISHSILGPRSKVKKGCIIRETYVMGNNFFSPPKHSNLSNDLFIGENTIIFKALIDKHVSIGKNVQLINKRQLKNYDSPNAFIRDGIIVIPRGATIPDGFIL